jgi:hypothetical protein
LSACACCIIAASGSRAMSIAVTGLSWDVWELDKVIIVDPLMEEKE